MNKWANTVLTEKGLALMAKLTQGNTLNITRAVTGAGFVTPGVLNKQTEVTDAKLTMTFKQVSYPETGKCAIPVALTNEGLAAGYVTTQVGLFAEDPDEGEILLFIAQATDEQSGTIIPSASEMPGYTAEWTFYLQYGQADGVTVTVDPANTVSRKEMEDHVDETFKNMKDDINMAGHKITNVAEPTQGSDVATRNFVEQHTLEGNLYVAVDYNNDGHIILKPYVADEDAETLHGHLKNKNNPHGVTAAQAGALPIAGGTLTGALSVGEKARIWTDTEGGNVRLYSPDGKTTDYWEMDSSTGEYFRIFAYKNATHPNGAGFIMPLDVYSDGSIGVGNAAKTRERLGAASESHSHKKSDISDFPSSMPASDVYAWAKASTKPSYTADEVGAIKAASVNLANKSVKEWAASVTGTAWAYTNSNTTDMPAEVSAANNYAIATVISVANGGWKELRLNYLVTGCVAVCVYNYGWGEWEWENPPLTLGTVYRTTERYDGKPVYIKLFNCGTLPNNTTRAVSISGATQIIDAYGVTSTGQKLPTRSLDNWIGNEVSINYNTFDLTITTNKDRTSETAYVVVKYTKE